MVQRGDPVELRLVDDDNVVAVIRLSVAPKQADFVAPNATSLAQAFATSKVWVRAVYAGDEPVGFAMLSDDDERPRYYLWRFMVDQRYQRMGFGSQAMALVHDYVRTRPSGDRVYLSYVPAEGGPERFYKSLGYEDTGVEHDGELEAVLTLTGDAAPDDSTTGDAAPGDADVSIREFEEPDLDACRELYAQLVEHHREIYHSDSIGGDDPGAGFDDYLASPERVVTWVAVDDGEIVGMTGLLWAGQEATIEPVVAARASRRNGIGRRLIETAIEESRRRGATDVNIKPVARNSTAIQAFHELGFRTLGHLQLFMRLDDDGGTRWQPGPRIHDRPFDL